MELNPSIEMIIDPGKLADGMAPTIARREISTTVTVPDGETIVLSGLIQEDQTEAVRRIPILGSIPLLGWLFRHKISDKKKTNLLVFVTPHIVTDHAAARKMTEAWDKKTTLEAVSGKSSDEP
jgi:general secretion pathway protein D